MTDPRTTQRLRKALHTIEFFHNKANGRLTCEMTLHGSDFGDPEIDQKDIVHDPMLRLAQEIGNDIGTPHIAIHTRTSHRGRAANTYLYEYTIQRTQDRLGKPEILLRIVSANNDHCPTEKAALRSAADLFINIARNSGVRMREMLVHATSNPDSDVLSHGADPITSKALAKELGIEPLTQEEKIAEMNKAKINRKRVRRDDPDMIRRDRPPQKWHR